jgi:hypothetical protein
MEGPPPIPMATGTGTGAAAATAPAKSGNVLKIVLIVLAVIFVLGVSVVGGLIYMGKRMVESAIQTSDDGKSTKVETPFGKFESNQDPKAVMEKLGVEPYPGASPGADGTNSATIGQLEITNAQFQTSASIDEVIDFYRGKYPEAQLMDLGQSKMLSMGERERNQVVITVTHEDGETTNINIARTAKRE